MKKNLLLFGLISMVAVLRGQHFSLSDSLVVTCTGEITAPAEPGDTLFFSTLICSQNSGKVAMTIIGLELDPLDTLRFYDGIDTDAPLIVPPFGLHNQVQASISAGFNNTSGCILVTYTRGNDTTQSDWEMQVVCTAPCQRIVHQMVAPLDTFPTTQHIDICTGETLQWEANVLFPENNASYTQSPETTTTRWLFSDGETIVGDNVSRNFFVSGIYYVLLQTIDSKGCVQTDYLPLRVQVAEPITLTTSPLPQVVCPGDTVTLYTGTALGNGLPGIGWDTLFLYHQLFFANTSPILIPDGAGILLESPILVTGYPATQTVQQDMLPIVHVNMEHSYSGDLEIELVCPTGESVQIFNFPSGTGSTNFGEPFASAPLDGMSNINCPGVGYDYTFRDDATNGTLVTFDPQAPSTQYSAILCQPLTGSFIYTDTYFPAQDYRPQSSFDALVGCPLNGEWKLGIGDFIGADNGWLFSWSLELGATEGLYINTVQATLEWIDPTYAVSQNQDSIQWVFPEPGMYELPFSLTNSFGCTQSGYYPIEVLPADTS
ncbi:MAG: proprotein convertase P-domain-containing protein [Saprospiraceae bacterium]